MLAWEDKRHTEPQKKQVSYLLHQNRLLEKVVVNLKTTDTSMSKRTGSKRRTTATHPKPPATVQSIQSLITWAQRYMATVSPYVSQPDVSVSLVRDSLLASIELAQASIREWDRSKPTPVKATLDEETLVVRKKLLQFQAQKALDFANRSSFPLTQTFPDHFPCDDSLSNTKLSALKGLSFNSTPKSCFEIESKRGKYQGEMHSGSLTTVQSQDSLVIDTLTQQKTAAENAISSLSLQLSQANDTIKTLKTALETANFDISRHQIALTDSEIALNVSKMHFEDSLSHISRLDEQNKGLQMDISSLIHDNSSAEPCNCVFTRVFPSDLLAELEEMMKSVKEKWQLQLDLEDKLRLEVTNLQVENDGLKANLKEIWGVKGEFPEFQYTPLPVSTPDSHILPENPGKRCPSPLQEIAYFEERMKKCIETGKLERQERSSDEYDSSALGRMEVVEADCSFGMESASPVPPMTPEKENPGVTLKTVQRLVFEMRMKPEELQNALRTLFAQESEGQFSPPLSPNRSPELLMSFEAGPKPVEPLRCSLDSTGAPPSVRDAVLRLLSEVTDPGLSASAAALSAFFQLTEAEVQQAKLRIRSD